MNGEWRGILFVGACLKIDFCQLCAAVFGNEFSDML